MKRRSFLGAAAAAIPLARLRLPRSTPGAPVPVALPFDLDRVTLQPGAFLDAMHVNRRFVMGMDPDRLLHTFRLTAGLPTSAQPLGGWEAPDNELKGHYTGHYLSACALLTKSLNDAKVKARGDLMVTELARCQQPDGYLSAFPEEYFDRLRDGRPVWAPFYTLHKIMAGFLDMHTLAGNAQALEVVRGMARWTDRWSQPLGDALMARVLEREYGGMNEVLYNLADVTGTDYYREVAHRFDHERIFGPLAAGRDELKGLHVNTKIPKIIGAARRYELTGEPRYRAVAEFFWRDVTTRRAYATGGTSNGESWNTDPNVLAAELSGYTEESCTTYNMLKLTRKIFSWTADPAAADYYERALYNGMLGTQHPDDGSKVYYLPLGTGFWKLFGAPMQDFWCCTGSGSESFAKFGDSIYFHDDDGVWVNLFIPSTLEWREKGVTIAQETRFPDEAGTSLTIHAPRPTRLALRVRVPSWTRAGGATLNGHALEGFAAPGGYFVIDRTWHDGDKLAVSLPMSLHTQPMPDDPNLRAVMYGPIVLAGRLGTEGFTPATLRAEPTKPRTVPEYKLEAVAAPAIRGPVDDPSQWLRRERDGTAFRTFGQERELVLEPLNGIFDERYAVYWRFT
ncbi:MAG TPA: beta-L-arabinofuranosidase domain-containing protein [Gemmatimonadales bacterium]|jgi:hypothetical protein